MRIRYCSCVIILAVACFAGSAAAVDHVDIGVPASEAGHNMLSWGPVEPATSGGAYGGIDDCRAIWSTLDNSVNALVTMDFGDGVNVLVAFQHLEGIGDDSYDVYIDGVLKFSYTETLGVEMWATSGFYTTVSPGLHVLEFVATGPQWAQWGSFGQVCFSDIWVGMEVVPDGEESWGGVKTLFR